MRDGHNGYGPSAGIRAGARSGRGANTRATAFRSTADRVFITAGTSEGIELALSALVDDGGEVLVPMPTYPLYTAVLAKLGAQAKYYRARSGARLDAGSRSPREPGHAGDARARRHRSEQPDRRASIRPRRGARCSTSPTRTASLILADEVYGDLGYDGPVAPHRQSRSRRADHLVLEPVEGVSRAGLAHRLDGDRPLAAAGRRAWRRSRKLADGRLCSTVPMQYAVARGADRRPLASAGVPRARSKARAAAHGATGCARCRASRASRRPRPFYAMPRVALPPGRTDEDYVLGAAARDRRAVRLRIRLRPARRRGISPHRVSRAARRAAATIYELDGGFHGTGLSRS